MAEKQSLIIALKETFIVRVLIGKSQDAGIECGYVPCVINEIYQNIEGASIITLYMDENDLPGEDVIHFLVDRLSENNMQMILIGEQTDLQRIERYIPKDLIYREFSRPVDNAQYIDTVKDYISKAKSGEFKKTILVVDDDPNYLAIVREWLKDNFKVFMVNSGLQAIKWLGKNKVDLILLDHEMPVTSGPQVLEMLRSDEETKGIPVMFLTGKSDKESVMAVVSLKPEGYFLKTIQKNELIEKLEEFFILHK
ncbi:response regulator [Butyrivibrio sp.]|uniref:response regulator n=1 Tax=Butyrivibrio sp. TaxID=28121 RepID=UPI0025CD0DE1|nr:response regulator [Butyrivibrio sp.]